MQIVEEARDFRLLCFGQSRRSHLTRLFPRPSTRELDRLHELKAITWRADMRNYTTNTETGDVTPDLRVVPTAEALASLASNHDISEKEVPSW